MDDFRFSAFLMLAAFAAGPVPALAAGASPPASRPAGWPDTADAQVVRDSVIVQVTRTMSLDLPGAADDAFPLFGPVREAEWSPGWSPSFVTPPTAAQTPDGAVFTTGDGDDALTWVMTDFDPARRIVRYVHVRPGRLLAQLWIEVREVSAHASRADVTYRYTRLGPAGDPAITHFIAMFPHMRHHWEEAIGGALSGGRDAHGDH